jgi:hypothetical protein
MSDDDATQAILQTLQHDCADAATVLGLVASCPDRLARVKPALLLQLRRMQPTLASVIAVLSGREHPDDREE